MPVDTSGIPNDHWGYAITWFLLAAVWAGDDSVSSLAYQAPDGLKGDMMHYISTRGAAPVLSFGEAMMTGLARDGGLYVPEVVPVMAQAEIAALAGLPYEEVAFRVMRPFLGGFFAR